MARLRQLLAGRLTKVVVVLLQTDTSTPTDSVMTALCAQCGLSSRAIFPLRVEEGEEVAGRVVQLESAVQELAQNYYHAQIKVVRGHREQLNRTSHLKLPRQVFYLLQTISIFTVNILCQASITSASFQIDVVINPKLPFRVTQPARPGALSSPCTMLPETTPSLMSSQLTLLCCPLAWRAMPRCRSDRPRSFSAWC